MAKAFFSCAKCGAAVAVNKGNASQSKRYAVWCESEGRTCDDCSKAAFSAAHTAAVAAAAVDPRNADLPALVGSEKQVAWAQALRLAAIPVIEEARDDLLAEAAREPLGVAARAELADAIHLVALQETRRCEATHWIDLRDASSERRREAMRREIVRRGAELAPTAAAEAAGVADGALHFALR